MKYPSREGRLSVNGSGKFLDQFLVKKGFSLILYTGADILFENIPILTVYNHLVPGTLLQTKLFIPSQRPAFVLRDRLYQKIRMGLEIKMTAVIAPAGFGKTTLVVDWLNNQDMVAAWYSLDETDNLPARFFAYLVAAIQSVEPDFARNLALSLNEANPPETANLIPVIINELTTIKQPLLIVLDDFHVISNEHLLAAVESIVNNLPAGAHLLLTSRDEPILPLHRWRVRGQLNEIRAEDLRFTQAEASQFFDTTMSLNLAQNVVSELEKRTEGWIAGLQLAALSLRSHEKVDQLLAGFTGSERQVADYLLHEVFFQQGQDLQNFLLQTSILERFNSRLCDELLSREDSQRLIDELDQRNLFLIPLDGSRHWFRYHHLFSEFLRDRLKRDWSQQDIKALHRRAADWYEAQGSIEESVQQYFQIEEYAEIARLIASLPINFLYEAGGSIKIVDWGLRLPKQVLAQFPMAGVMLVGAALLTGNTPVLLEYFELIKRQESVQPYLDLFGSVLARNEKGDHAQALKLALRAASAGPQFDPSLAPMAWMQAAVNYANMGQLEDVDEAVSKMVQSIRGENALTLNMRIYAAEIQVLSTLAQGEYQKAEHICLNLVDMATDGERVLSPLVGVIYSYLGNIYYQWNDLPAAQLYFEKCIHLARQSGISDMYTYANVLQANLAATKKDKAALQQALESFASLASNAQMERMQFVSARMAAWFWLRIGKLDKAVEWVRQTPNTLKDEPEFDDFDTYHTLVAVCLEENRRAHGKHNLAEMLVMVEKLEHLAVVSHHQIGLIDALNLKALLLDYQRNHQAIVVIQRALELAKPGRLIRIFLEWGIPLRELLVRAVSVDPAYVGQLLKAFDSESSVLDFGAESVQLTVRENEILQLIAAGLPNKQIEETLLISKNTVRTHIKNLYSKLNVNSRTQALQKARQLALLD